MSSAGSDQQRHLAGLDGLRGIACLLVFVYHLRWAAGDPPLTLAGFDVLGLLKNCDIGVAIFFVLSGLLLSLPFWGSMEAGARWPDFAPYLWRRLCRIVPAYYACLIVVYLLQGGTYTLFGFLDFLLHATFLHTFSDQSYLSHHGVLWTIGIEFQFYLLLPILMGATVAGARSLGKPLSCLLLVGLTLGLDLLATIVLRGVEPFVPDRFLGADGKVLAMGTIFHYLKYFALGITAGAAALHWRKSPPGVWAASLGLLGSLVVLFVTREGAWRETTLTGWPFGIAAFALFAAALPSNPGLARIFHSAPLRFMGEISYGAYLWHELILKAVFAGTLPGRFHGAPLLAVGGIIALGVTLLVSWLSFRTIEAPAMRSSYPFVTPSEA